jgi:periplasmic protein TonB
MFHYITESPSRVGRRRAYVPLSILAHLTLVALAIVVPVFAPNVLPVPASTLTAFISQDVPQPPPPPQALRAQASAPRSQPPPDADADPFAAPIVPPAAIAPERVGETTQGLMRDVEGGAGNIVDSTLGSRVEPPPPPTPVEPDMPHRVGSNITRPKKILDVTPVYPVLAQASRVSGMVIIEATIGPTGDVLDARVLRGHPLLDRAALDAVRQWRYTPTLLNGKAIAIVMTVTVEFKLQ